MIPGIDVSKWQDDNSTPQKMDFSKSVDQGVKFVFIKASDRMGVDGDFLWNWESAKCAGLLRGAYHFLRWDVSGIMQARFFCAALGDDLGELPLVADYEAPPLWKNGKPYLYPSNALLFQFLEEVQTITGKIPMIYTSLGFWNSHGMKKGSNYFDQKWAYYPLWLAQYTKAEQPTLPKPWKKWLFWQHGVYPVGMQYGAESKSLDLNWFNGDLVDLLALAGVGDVVSPEDPPPADPLSAVQLSMRLSKLENLIPWAKGIGYKA